MAGPGSVDEYWDLPLQPGQAPPASLVEKIVTVRLKEDEAYGRP